MTLLLEVLWTRSYFFQESSPVLCQAGSHQKSTTHDSLHNLFLNMSILQRCCALLQDIVTELQQERELNQQPRPRPRPRPRPQPRPRPRPRPQPQPLQDCACTKSMAVCLGVILETIKGDCGMLTHGTQGRERSKRRKSHGNNILFTWQTQAVTQHRLLPSTQI